MVNGWDSSLLYLLWSTHHSPTPSPSPLHWQADQGNFLKRSNGACPRARCFTPLSLSSNQGGWRCRDVWGGGVKRCTTDEAPPGLSADSSPPKHFSSHQSRHAGREACSSSLHHVSFFPSLGCSVLARPWATVPSSHTPAGWTWCPASSIIPKVNCFNKDCFFSWSRNSGSAIV